MNLTSKPKFLSEVSSQLAHKIFPNSKPYFLHSIYEKPASFKILANGCCFLL